MVYGIIPKIKVALGLSYNKHSHSYHTDRLGEGEMMKVGENEFIKNEKNAILYCKKDKKGNLKCKRTPIKIE